uniref:Uncharacterized protein n=1 Tax=Leptobrachium leishanense TaxID=445787 RepID=A0A8C5MAM8_9ANUR
MASADLRDELTCSICLNIYTDPVTLPCGHSFCRTCIGDVLDAQEGSGAYKCPECRAESQERPALVNAWKLRNIADNIRSTHPQQEEAGIPCTYCIQSPVRAAKTCLLCEASLCEDHLRVHSKSAEHVLTEPTTSLENRKCSVHKKVLEYYCCEDASCICVSCSLAGEHRGHQVETLNEASEKKKEKLRNILQTLTSQREEAEKRVQSLEEHRRQAQGKAAGVTERVTAMIRDIREQLETLEKQVLSEISRQEEQVSFRVSDLIRQLEIKKEELSRKMGDIEELCDMTDPVTVLQRRESDRDDYCDAEEDTERRDIKVHDAGDLDVGLISVTLHLGLAGIVTRIRWCHVPEASDMLLDVNTASHMLLDVNTASHMLPDVNTASDMLLGVNTASHMLLGVNTASDMLPGVNTASDMLPDVNTASHMLPDVNTASDTLLDVNTASDTLLDVNTASDMLLDVNMASDRLPDVNTASHMLLGVNTASDMLPDVNTASDMLPDVNTASDMLLGVNTASDMLLGVNTASDMLPDVNTASHMLLDVNTASHMLLGVNTASDMLPDVNTASDMLPDVNTASDMLLGVNTASHMLLGVNTGSDMLPDVNTASHMLLDVNTASDTLLDVNTASHMLLDVNTASDMLLDVYTASHYVSVSEDLKTVSWSGINQRFQDYPQVLSSRSFSSGRHYWEVEVSESGRWRVGMTYPSIERRGWQSLIGNNNKSWGLQKVHNKKYYMLHDSNYIEFPHSFSCHRLGIFLDYEAGLLSFYELCDPIRHLHTFTAAFTEPLHAGFGVFWDNSWVKI